ncbi:FMN reductase [Geothrix limicola]|uniref:FMN reductase n=1 Tax=Geothrix limicola TaxID=2927978 RepID=A0ABQ5QCB0_9BACT|nr:flavodoxin family protein [Geothrix limicola]GLH72460.1 FMN reductase [Geothrix limicola]
MSQIAIVYHSGFGHTKVVAEQVKAGAESVPGTKARLISVEEVDAHWADLEAADAIVFGSPTYMGNVSGPFKTFMDASSKAWFEQKWKDKLAAGFTISGSPSGDKLNTLQSLMIFAMQHGMVWVGNAEMPYNEEGINRLGSFSGVMAQAGQVAPEVEPNAADRKSAERLGHRLATATARWAKVS